MVVLLRQLLRRGLQLSVKYLRTLGTSSNIFIISLGNPLLLDKIKDFASAAAAVSSVARTKVGMMGLSRYETLQYTL